MNRMSIAGHPIHPMLVTVPIGLWIFSLVCDLVFAANGEAQWRTTAYLTLGGGIIGALLAAIPGLIDLLNSIPPGSRVRRRAWTHAALNVTALAIWVVSLSAREDPGEMTYLAYATAALGTALVGVSGWLGGTLVYENHVGVEGTAVREE